MVSAARLAAHLGHGVTRLGVDGALARVRSFPRRVSDLTPEALSAVMDRTVESVTVIDGEAGTSSRARLALTGPDVPASVFVKLSAATAATRMLGEMAGLGEPRPASTVNWRRDSGTGFRRPTDRPSIR
jgi:hypothetical protein